MLFKSGYIYSGSLYYRLTPHAWVGYQQNPNFGWKC